MSNFGIAQLIRLRVKYSPIGGSSRGARDFVGNLLPKFTRKSPKLEVIVEEIEGHPSLYGEYRTGHHSTVDVANFDAKEIEQRAKVLRDSKFRESQTVIKRHVTSKRSIQGTWTPKTNIN